MNLITLDNVLDFSTRVLPLVLVIIVLSINILVVIFGFFNVRNMGGRWITGVIQILTIVFALFAPSFKDELIGSGAFILAGAASVLFSRTLTYMVKPIKPKVILWILTILFSIFAPVLFALLILTMFFFSSMGEEGLGMLILSFIGMCIVASLAFVFNISVTLKDKARVK